ncbi:hypothetical protein [Clostridium sp. 'White wine YQ']|uniref:hypothetical protein n=1 Tax=Clostridium sp. 'White wine YQ' TaxID=3027474 RepID=UPI002365FEFB|nr:hypothetical protein [Clostridium sp. 'White wine YQ']MDD7794275.1 hypothetical protein [Clostridium sp. 'White wine YQ']
MRKFLAFFMIFSCTFLYTILPISAVNIFKEGVYKLSDLNISAGNFYTAQNLSKDSDIFVQIYNGDREVQQFLRIPPGSRKFTLVALKPDYRLVILGSGELFISEERR